MVKQEIFMEAIAETLKNHPMKLKDLKRWFYGSIMEGANVQSFTRENDVRNKVRDICSDNFLSLTVENVIHYYYLKMQGQDKKVREKVEEECEDLIQIMKNPSINTAIYFKTHSEKLLQAIDISVKYLYQTKQIPDNLIPEHSNLLKKVFSDIEAVKDINKIEVNYKTINACILDILDGTQLKNQRTSYFVDDNLYATQDVGKVRANQEDSVLIMTHPEVPEFKFLVVSDGMGGVEYGEQASNYVVKQLSEWFSSLSKDLYTDPDLVAIRLNDKIQKISREIYYMFNKENLCSGATLVAAVVTKEKTIISSIGDSRAYLVNESDISLITKDESAAYLTRALEVDSERSKLDDIRFAKNGNIILRCMGMEEVGEPQLYMISNHSYDKLLLFSDGVTDALATDRIRVIAQNSPVSKIADLLVQEAVTQDSIRKQGEDLLHYGKIVAGHDNATAAVYDNSGHRRK